jgi:hypothetical protein
MHLLQIFYLLTWPALIYISYRMILIALKKYEQVPEPEEKEGPDIVVID